MRFINGTRLDDRIIRTDWDVGFKEGRQYGRGKSGGQVSAWLGRPGVERRLCTEAVPKDYQFCAKFCGTGF